MYMTKRQWFSYVVSVHALMVPLAFLLPLLWGTPYLESVKFTLAITGLIFGPWIFFLWIDLDYELDRAEREREKEREQDR